ncbi:MAG: hypothetical protein KUG83_07320 [Gammaproteobacteria bacterium]|nr:hypothetical protein [Gammaproteobacteria bacterium]
MEIIDSFGSSQFIVSILGLFLVNTLIFMIVLLLRQKNSMETELLRIQDQIAALADSTYGVKKRVVEAEKRISARISALKSPPKVVRPVEESQEHLFSTSGFDVQEKPISKSGRSASKAEDDILAAIGGL